MSTAVRSVITLGFATGFLLIAVNVFSALVDGRQRLLLTRHVLLEDVVLLALGFSVALAGRVLLTILRRRA